jgi:hypothetical protein
VLKPGHLPRAPYGPPHLGFVPELLDGEGIAPLHRLGASAACNSALEGYAKPTPEREAALAYPPTISVSSAQRAQTDSTARYSSACCSVHSSSSWADMLRIPA